MSTLDIETHLRVLVNVHLVNVHLVNVHFPFLSLATFLSPSAAIFAAALAFAAPR
jgi:hypothetical protein